MTKSTVETSTKVSLDMTEAPIQVLHVDDEAGFLKASKQILEMQGAFEVETASSVEEAMEKIEEKTYDVIISDYVMPEKGGLDFLKDLRQKGDTIPFIIFTGKGREEVAIEALNLGADHYINKIGAPETVYGQLANCTRKAVERKRAEMEIWQREEKLRAILASSPDAITASNLQGNIFDCNEAAWKMLGFSSKEELVGKSSFEFIAEKDRKRAWENLKKTLEEGTVRNVEYTLTKKDGEEYMGELSASILKDSSGNPIGFVGVVRDVTERKKAEEELQERRERYRELTESISDVFFAMDKDFRYTYWNKASERLTWISAKNAIGKSLTEVFPDVKGTKIEQFYLDTLRTKQHQTLVNEYRVGDKDFVFEIDAYPTENGLSVFVKDITERKQAEEKLSKSETRFRSLVEDTGAGIITVDIEGRFTFVNKAICRMIGYSEKELLDKPFVDFIHPEDKARILQIFWNFMTYPEQRPSFDFEVIHKNGHTVHLHSTPTLFKHGEKIVGSHAILTDITGRKKAEEERNKLLGDYVKRVKELRCLYGIAKLVEKPKISLEEILRGTNDLLPAAWRYPDVACSRVVFGNREFKTKNFKETQWRQCSDIEVNGKKVGSVEIYYLEQKPTIAEGPFSEEERVLIDAVAERLGRIIERKKTENALKGSEERYRSLFELAPDSIITANAKGVVTSVNTTFTMLTGFSKDEIIGKHFTKVGTIRKRDLPMFLKMFTSILRGKAPEPFEVMWKHKDGTTHPTEIHVTSVKSDGKTIGFQAITRDITERKKAKEALRNANEKWISLMENTDDVIMVLDGKGTIQYLNPASLATNPREVIGKSVYEYVPREQHDIMRKSLRRVFKTGKPDSYEVSPIIQGIDTIWFNTKVVPIKHDKNIVSVILVSTNITERKKTEKVLRESEERFRTIFEGAADGILAADPRTQRFVFANPRACEITGYSSEELLKLSVNDIHPKEDLPYVIDQFTKQLEGKSTLSTDIPVLKKDKQVVYCDASSKMLKTGKQQYIVGFFKDVTERNEAEEKLETERRKLRDIIEAIADSVCITDLDDKITMVNKTMVDSFQVSREKLLTLKGFDLATKEDLPKISKAMQNLFKTGLPQNAEVTGRLGGAKGKPFWIRFSSLKDEKGRPTGFVTVTRDITERKKTQEKLVMMNEKLRVVGGLTRHDVRNKLSAARMNIFLAKKKLTDNKEALKHLWEIDVAIGLTEKIFDFARTYEKLGMEELAYMDVEKSLKKAVMLFSDLHGVKVVNDCHGLTVLADSLLRQLFYNLIHNSLKHGEKVGRIRVYYEEAGKDRLKLVYEDDGVGIPKAEKEKIFEKGFGKGTGYGLYLIRKMCDVYDWSIKETGKHGKGAQFTITMPRMHKEGRESYVFTDALQSIEKILRADLI